MHRVQMKKKAWISQNKPTVKLKRFILSLACIVIMPGCSSLFFGGYGANGLSHEDFVRYVEEVFRLQNKMTSEMMLLSEDESASSVLLQAEQQMHTMCASLNEYVSRDIDGLYKGILLRRRVEDSAMDCDKAAHALGALLKKP